LADSGPFPTTALTANPKSQRKFGFKTFVWLVILLVGLGILRSAIVTRLDGFTLDEAYHIAAGVSYVKYGDFRINPEHPPLVKLWVGSVIAATGFHLDVLRRFSDKPDERTFTERNLFRKNDPDSVQRRARAAMFAFNGLLLISLAFALERVFDARVALGALLFLVIDPTVAAHLPVVMTDLPVALLSATAIVLATRAFRDWIWTDLAASSAFLGLALATKHSAPVVLLSVGLIGVWLAFSRPLAGAGDTRWRRLLKLASVVAGALAILWGFYHFRYTETRTGQESFNRSLADKIRDVNSPFYHSVLVGMNATHVVPRAYLWGFADTVHAGLEGRLAPQLIFGRMYARKGPKYFFPAMIAIKLPIGWVL
jgi:dolichyl-phosphate-mannose--protein O-mannosyl transferase